MHAPASRRISSGSGLVASANVTWYWPPGSLLPEGRADDPPEHRQELEPQAIELLVAGTQAYQRGELTTAVEETRKSLQLFERPLSQDGLSQGTSRPCRDPVRRWALCSRPRGTTWAHGGTLSVRWR